MMWLWICLLVAELLGHFRAAPESFPFKTRLGTKPFLGKWVLFAWEERIIFSSMASHLASFKTEVWGISEKACSKASPHVFRIPGTIFQYLSVELGFWIPIGSGIPDSLSCIPDSKTRVSGFYKQNFPDSTRKNIPDSLTCSLRCSWPRALV